MYMTGRMNVILSVYAMEKRIKFQLFTCFSSLTKALFLPAILLLASALCTQVSANDGTYYTEGNQLLPLVETDIRVQREVLTLSWGDDGMADVDVYYEFFNPGKGKTVLMGFEADAPDYMSSLDRSGAHPAIKGFTVKMNGKDLPVSTSVVNVDTLYVNDGKVLALDLSRYDVDEAHTGSWLYTREGDGVHIAFVYHFNAAFKPGVNIVRHHYRYRMDESVVFKYKFDYKLTPVLRWGNRRIDDFTLRIKADSVPLHFMVEDSLFSRKVDPVIEGTGKWRRRIIQNDGWPEKMPMAVYEVFLRNASIEYKVKDYRPASELRVLSAVCTETGDINAPSDYYAFRYNLVRPDTLDNDMYRKVRNLSFALRGYVFKDAALDGFFRSRWWYMPDTDYAATLESLTDSERRWLIGFDEKYKEVGSAKSFPTVE